MRVSFAPLGPRLEAGCVGTCLVEFPEAYEGERADLVVEVLTSEYESGLARWRWFSDSRDRFAGPVEVEGVQLPRGAREVRLRASLFRTSERDARRAGQASAIEGWSVVSEPLRLAAARSGSDRAYVGRVGAVTSFFDVLAAREPRQDVCGTVEEVLGYVIAGLRADLDGLIDRTYHPLPGEIDEDGSELQALQPWQKWAIKYCSGLYYTQNGRAYAAMRAGLGYPIGVACTPNADLYAYARGIDYGSVNTLPAGNGDATPQQDRACERVARANPRGEYSLGFAEDALRPGSILTFQGHINTVFRVRRTRRGVEYQLFDTAGTGVARRHRVPSALLGSWGGAMKEEPWRRGPLSYGTGEDAHAVRGHLWIPRRETPRLPTTLYYVPDDWSHERITAESRRSPTVRLCVVRRPDTVLYTSAPMPLTLPLTQLLFSVSNLPNSDELEARWLIDGGNYHNHRRPPSGRLLLEIYNAGQARGTDRGVDPAQVIGKPRLWRPGYVAIEGRRSDYLAEDPDEHRPRNFAFDPSALSDERDQALYAPFRDHPLDTPL